MEYVSGILSSFSNNWVLLIIVTILLSFIVVSVRKGWFSFQKNGVRIGIDTISASTRIKSLQWDYLQAETEIALRKLPKEYLEDSRIWRTHYVVGKYRDVLQLSIMNNNITDDEEYIESKQRLTYAEILKVTEDEFFRTEKFEEFLDALTRKIILQFVKIKKKYEGTA